MARASPLQNSFNAGEFSPRLESRVDIGKYGAAAKLMEGFIPLLQGPAMRRGGTRFVAEIKNSANRAWLVKFEFNTQQAYQLEFGPGYIRFFANHGRVVTSGVAAYNAGTTYAQGDLVTFGGVTYYSRDVTPAGNQPDISPGYWYAQTGNIYEIPTVYTAADLTDSDGNFRLRFVESADIIYITSASWWPYKLSRLGPTQWIMTQLVTAGGPFKDENITATTMYASAASGIVTVNASTAVFSPALVGSLLQLTQKSVIDVHAWEAGKAVALNDIRRSDGKNYKALNAATTGGNKPVHLTGAVFDGDTGVQWAYQDPGFGCVRIDSYNSPTQISGTVVSPFPAFSSNLPAGCVGAPNATTRWALGAWSGVEGFPTAVAFFRERLCFGRGQTVWMSVSGDYETFTAIDQSSLITTDMAITQPLQSSKVNNIQWMETTSSSTDALVCGTAGSEFVVKSMTDNSPFGTDNRTASMISTLGSRNAAPVLVGAIALFVQRSGSKLRDVDYDFYSNKFVSIDQSVLAEHIAKVGINQLAYQQEPYSLIWGARVDGLLVCMTYSREQYPEAPHGGWHRHPIGGNGFVESLSVNIAPDNSRDELWMIVRRTINGVTRRYVEYMEWERRPNDDPEDSFYVDCGLTLNNVVNTTLTPGIGATTDGATFVQFNTGTNFFAPTDVGRQIQYRYSTTDAEGVVSWFTARATITTYSTPTAVLCTIDVPFPSLAVIPANGWRITVTTVSGLSHLEGETVDILINGATHPQRVVTGGAISLQYPASKVHVGKAFLTKLQTLRLNAGAQDGTSQGKKARINQASLRLQETLGLQYGVNFTEMFDIDFRTPADPMDQPPPIFNGDKLVDWPGDWDTSPWLCFQQPYPLPATIVHIAPQATVSDKG